MRNKRILPIPVGLTLAIAASAAMAANPFPGKQPPSPPDAWMHDRTSGPAGVNSWAMVNANGTLLRGRNATGSSRLDKGNYEVDFNSDIRDTCSYTATVGSGQNLGNTLGALISVDGKFAGKGQKKAVLVNVINPADATGLDRPFIVNIEC